MLHSWVFFVFLVLIKTNRFGSFARSGDMYYLWWCNLGHFLRFLRQYISFHLWCLFRLGFLRGYLLFSFLGTNVHGNILGWSRTRALRFILLWLHFRFHFLNVVQIFFLGLRWRLWPTQARRLFSRGRLLLLLLSTRGSGLLLSLVCHFVRFMHWRNLGSACV